LVNNFLVPIVQNYLRAVQNAGYPVSFGVLFGSQARGDAGKDSDIDLLVVSPSFDGEHKREDLVFLWRLAARIDSRIEPNLAGEREYEMDDSRAILEYARREGVVIHPY
jgi:predicted nucleotidyltransferase